MINKLIPKKAFTYSITSAALVMMVAILATKATGFLRQSLYSQKFYGSGGLDIFYAANLIPEIIFNIIALGSINAVLIPVMTKAISKEGHEKASYIFSSIINIGIVILSIASILMIIFANNVVSIGQNFGFITKFSSEEINQLVSMMRLLLISPIILGVSSIVSAILQIKKHFLITQISPLVYNLSGILGLFIFVPFFGLYGLAFGVILGSLLHLLVQLPAFKITDIKYHPGYFELNNKYTRHTGKLMAPRLIGLAGDQLVLSIQTIIALVYPFGALSAFRNALTLRDIPISLFGLTLSQAAFPTLSSSATEDDMTSFKKYFVRTFQQIIFLSLPFAIFMMVLRLPIVRLAFGVGNGLVTWDATKLTALILFFMCISVVWLALVNILVRAFYSLSNTITPLVVSVISIIIEITCSILFSNMFSYLPNTSLGSFLGIFQRNSIQTLFFVSNPSGQGAVAGIALATVFGSTLQVILLSILLSRKIRIFKRDFFISLLKKIVSALMLGISAYFSMQLIQRYINTEKTYNVLFILIFCSLIGFGVYFYSEYLLDDEEFSLINKLYKKIKGVIMHNKRVINQIYKSFIISQQKES